MSEKITTTVRLSKDSKEILAKLAKINNTNLSAMLEKCIYEYSPNTHIEKGKYYADLENCLRLIMLNKNDITTNICTSFLNISFNNKLITEQELNELKTLIS